MGRDKHDDRKRKKSVSKDRERKRRHSRDHDREKERRRKPHGKDRKYESSRSEDNSKRKKEKRKNSDKYVSKHKIDQKEDIKEDRKKEAKIKIKPEIPKIEKKVINQELEEKLKKAALEAEQKLLLEAAEEERKKRKERIQAWQDKIKQEKPEILNQTTEGKEWNLEDDQDSEEAFENQKNEEELYKELHNIQSNDVDEIDPLDEFMSEIKDSLVDTHAEPTKIIVKEEEDEKVQYVETVIRASIPAKVNDGEILEQFGAAEEYSEEEEIEENLDFLANKRNTKILPPVDHKKVFYREFKKNFYIEVPEISKMTENEVQAYRAELDNITVKGKKVPRPIKKWVQLGLHTKILDIIKKLNYEKPTPIQCQACPTIMAGRDVIGIAKTGSGKTLAFLLPLLRHVLDQPPLEEGDGPIALVISPTRELAVQTSRECRKFAKALNLTCLCIFGGSVVSEQISQLKRGAEIVICTPGRMIDMLTVNCGKITNLRRVTYVVLDEADRMFDMGFEPQVYKILTQIRPDRQICLFSATFPLGIESLARKLLDKPIEIVVGIRNKVNPEIKQHLLLLSEDDKFLKLLEILGLFENSGAILVFVERQEKADELLRDLIVKGHPCMTLHGGRDQYDRDSTLNDFKCGNINILIATSVCARGIDVKNIVLVVNYDCPNHPEDYIHRCGRTGRAGNRGTAITFVTSKDARHIKDIISVIDPNTCDIPQSLINLHQRYMAIDHVRKPKSSGFSGHGFKFDDQEVSLAIEGKKAIKWSFGFQDSGDEAEAENKVLKKIEHDLDQAFSSRPKAITKDEESLPVDNSKITKAQEAAKKLNERLKLSGVISDNQFSNLVKTIPKIKPEVAKQNEEELAMAKAIAQKLNVKLDTSVIAQPKRETIKKVEGKEIYYEEIDINDFPQLARQRITMKETLDSVSEFSDCVITVKGSYCPTGKSIDISDRRLHLLIEANTEFKIQLAKAEIKRIIKEECVKSDYVFTQPSSRYRIT